MTMVVVLLIPVPPHFGHQIMRHALVKTRTVSGLLVRLSIFMKFVESLGYGALAVQQTTNLFQHFALLTLPALSAHLQS
jgi:hypothetical protein